MTHDVVWRLQPTLNGQMVHNDTVKSHLPYAKHETSFRAPEDKSQQFRYFINWGNYLMTWSIISWKVQSNALNGKTSFSECTVQVLCNFLEDNACYDKGISVEQISQFIVLLRLIQNNRKWGSTFFNVRWKLKCLKACISMWYIPCDVKPFLACKNPMRAQVILENLAVNEYFPTLI